MYTLHLSASCDESADEGPEREEDCRLFLALPADGRSLACTRGHFIPSNSLKRPQRPELCSIRQDPIEKPDGFYPSPALFAVLLFGLHPRIVLGIGVFEFVRVRGLFQRARLCVFGPCISIKRLGCIWMTPITRHQNRVLAFI